MIVIGSHVVEWVAKRTNEHGNYGAAVGIGIERDGEIIGGVAINEFNGANVNMHTAAARRHWLNREFLFVIFDYCFRQLKVARVTALVGEGNAHARKFIRKVGFVDEARISAAHPTGDLMVMTMWPDNCKWVRR